MMEFRAPERRAEYYYHQYSTEGDSSSSAAAEAGGDNFAIDDLLDFSNDDGTTFVDDHTTTTGDNSEDSSDAALIITANAADSCSNNNSSLCGADTDHQLLLTTPFSSDDLGVPYDDIAQLEWLSNFVEEDTFSSEEELQKLQLISGGTAGGGGGSSSIITSTTTLTQQPTRNSSNNIIDCLNPTPPQNSSYYTNPIFSPDHVVSIPAKARTKRLRSTTTPSNWATSSLLLTTTTTDNNHDDVFSTIDHNNVDNSTTTAPPPPPVINVMSHSRPCSHQTVGTGTTTTTMVAVKPGRKKVGSGGGVTCVNGGSSNGEGRRCLHCATDKTPQWRTGPLGPKTLCNACGVRFKSGRLVPEYRPAASPTFVMTKHSNSHRKVMELRRQKEMQRQMINHHQYHADGGRIVSSTTAPGDQYLLSHQHQQQGHVVGPNYGRMIH